MVTLILSVALVCCIYGVYRLSIRTATYHHFWSGVWRMACVIAAVRISALWLGSAGLRREGWPQIPGYLLLMLDLPEIYLIRAARYAPDRWAILGSLILAGTSLAWAAAFLWLWNRLVKSTSSAREVPPL
jgi:hypothetical protein